MALKNIPSSLVAQLPPTPMSAANPSHLQTANQTPTVSIIIPNYNYSRFLKERFNSILSQTFQDFEIIILDDASTDNSVDILKEYAKNPKVAHFVVNDQNSGSPFAQWKKGIELAKGKYIWIAEADDSSTPEFLERTVAVMDSNPNLALCITGSIGIDDNDNIIENNFSWMSDHRVKSRLGSTKCHKGTDYIVHNMFWGCYIYNASATLFRRSSIQPDMLVQSARMRNSGDWLFWTKLLEHGDVAEIYDNLNIIRRHSNTTTGIGRQSGNIYFEDIEVMRYIESNHNIGFFRKKLRYGQFYKFIKRTQFPNDVKQRIFDVMRLRLGITTADYRYERLHKILWHIIPGLLSRERDRL